VLPGSPQCFQKKNSIKSYSQLEEAKIFKGCLPAWRRPLSDQSDSKKGLPGKISIECRG